MSQNPGHIWFINPINDEHYDKFMSCNNTANNILQKGDKEFLWELKVITTHEEQLIVSHPNYKVSCCNVTVKWDIGETITDYINIIIGVYPIICDLYADDGQEKWERQKSGKFFYF